MLFIFWIYLLGAAIQYSIVKEIFKIQEVKQKLNPNKLLLIVITFSWPLDYIMQLFIFVITIFKSLYFKIKNFFSKKRAKSSK